MDRRGGSGGNEAADADDDSPGILEWYKPVNKSDKSNLFFHAIQWAASVAITTTGKVTCRCAKTLIPPPSELAAVEEEEDEDDPRVVGLCGDDDDEGLLLLLVLLLLLLFVDQ